VPTTTAGVRGVTALIAELGNLRGSSHARSALKGSQRRWSALSAHGPEQFARLRNHQANGMGGLPIVGDPDFVTSQLARLTEAGLTGIAVSFVN
jgi:hypothetical protein